MTFAPTVYTEGRDGKRVPRCTCEPKRGLPEGWVAVNPSCEVHFAGSLVGERPVR